MRGENDSHSNRSKVMQECEVENCQSFGGFVVHIGRVTRGKICEGNVCTVNANYQRRLLVAPNHTMTHVLNFALRQVLGTGCDQKGSLVDEDKLRFDFAYGKQLTPEQLEGVQRICEDQVKSAYEVFTLVAPLAQAREICTLRAVFGETYPDPVRVVSVGQPVAPMLADPKNKAWMKYSVEFCGGTHLANTNESEQFIIVSEEGIASGIRRIIAVTKSKAGDACVLAEEIVSSLDAAMKLADDPKALGSEIGRIRRQIDENVLCLPVLSKINFRTKITELSKLYSKGAKKMLTDSLEKATKRLLDQIDECKERGEMFIAEESDLGSDLKLLGNLVRSGLKHGGDDFACFLLSCDEVNEKVILCGGIGESLIVKGWNANEWMDVVAPMVGARGGGRPNMAQGSGPDLKHARVAIEKAREYARNKFN